MATVAFSLVVIAAGIVLSSVIGVLLGLLAGYLGGWVETIIMRAVVETGYQGWVGQEFVPKRDPVTSLGEAFHICDV